MTLDLRIEQCLLSEVVSPGKRKMVLGQMRQLEEEAATCALTTTKKTSAGEN